MNVQLYCYGRIWRNYSERSVTNMARNKLLEGSKLQKGLQQLVVSRPFTEMVSHPLIPLSVQYQSAI